MSNTDHGRKNTGIMFSQNTEHNSCINSEDPDQTAPQEQSDHSLHGLLTICKGFPQKENKGLRLSSKVEESITKLRHLNILGKYGIWLLSSSTCS